MKKGTQQMQMAIFDLDGTVINSDHRKATKPDGSLDLEHWFENNKPEKIALDGLFPLIYEMREIYDSGVCVIICTARTLQKADYEYFARNNIPFDYVISRARGDMTPDGELKKAKIAALLQRVQVDAENVEMWDDNESVITAISEIGVKCHDAKKYNKNYRHRA